MQNNASAKVRRAMERVRRAGVKAPDCAILTWDPSIKSETLAVFEGLLR